MLSKADIKFIKSLQVKKYRKHEQCFLAEGAKSVRELLDSDFEVTMVLGTADFFDKSNIRNNIRVELVKEKELEALGEFQSNDAAIAIARMKPNVEISIPADEFALVLDNIRDPGNLGTIIRTADWYGIKNIIASEETADFYNPKVISSTMGSFTRINIWYTDLEQFLGEKSDRQVYGAFLDGENIHKMTFSKGGYIVIGNESKGIGSKLEQFITRKVTIPRFGKAESLNAAIATAVICDNLRRGD